MPKNITWSQQEDLNLKDLVTKSQEQSNTGTVHWQDISKLLHERINSAKTARQCQHRWNYSLKPGVSKQVQWTHTQQNLLFELQQIHGNKWTFIGEKLGGKAEHQVKNYFYSALRKVIRNINSHMSIHRGEAFYKGRKPFPESCITKIVSLEQGKNKRLKANRSDIPRLANNIKSNLFRLVKNQDDSDLYKKTIEQLTDFNRNCRKLKGKKNKIRFNCSSDSSFEEAPAASKLPEEFKQESSHISEEECSELLLKEPLVKVEQQSSSEKNYLRPSMTANFWMQDNLSIQEQCNIKEERQSQFEDKKDELGLVRTRDVEEESISEEEMIQAKQENSGWDLDLPIQGILNLPALEDILEGKEEQLDFVMLRDNHIERSNTEEEIMSYEIECPFNQYFS